MKNQNKAEKTENSTKRCQRIFLILNQLLTKAEKNYRKWDKNSEYGKFFKRIIRGIGFLINLNILMVATTISIAYFAYKQSEISSEIKNVSENTLKIANRAYISLLNKPTPISKESIFRGNSFWETLTIKNTGQTPAHRVKGFVKFDLRKVNDTAFEIPDSSLEYIAEVMGKNLEFDLPPAEISFFKPNQISKIKNKKLTITLIGKVTYEDIFNDPRSLQFCFIYDIDKQEIEYRKNCND